MIPKRAKPKDLERKVRRSVDRQKRELKREEKDLDRDEKKIISEIRKAQAKGETETVKALAKNLVNLRKTKQMLSKGGAALNDVKLSVKQAATAAKMGEHMKKATKNLAKINKVNDLEKMTKNAVKYAKEVEKSQLKEEMTNDVLEGVFDQDGDLDEQAEQMADEVLAGLGIELSTTLESAPTAPLKQGISTQETEEDGEEIAV